MKVPLLVQSAQILTAASGVSCLLSPSPLTTTTTTTTTSSSLAAFTYTPSLVVPAARTALKAGLRDFVSDPREEEENARKLRQLQQQEQQQFQQNQNSNYGQQQQQQRSPAPTGGVFGGFGQRQGESKNNNSLYYNNNSLNNINRGSGTPLINANNRLSGATFSNQVQNTLMNNNNNINGGTISNQRQAQQIFQNQRQAQTGGGNININNGSYYNPRSPTQVPFRNPNTTNRNSNNNLNTNASANANNFNSNNRGTTSFNNNSATNGSRPTFSIPRQGTGTFPIGNSNRMNYNNNNNNNNNNLPSYGNFNIYDIPGATGGLAGSGTNTIFARPSNYVNPTTRDTTRETFSDGSGPLRGAGTRGIVANGGTRGVGGVGGNGAVMGTGTRSAIGGGPVGAAGAAVGGGLGGIGGGGSATPVTSSTRQRPSPTFASTNPVEQYFEAWNQRNIPLALSCFDDNIYYDDTQFSNAFEGKEKLAKHLIYVADCLPDSFVFVVDGLSVGAAMAPRISRNGVRSGNSGRRDGRGGGGRMQEFNPTRVRPMNNNNMNSPPSTIVQMGALWHVENENGPLPFARGCSFYKVDPSTNLIIEGYDFPEPAVLKGGAAGLRVLSLASKLIEEPVRFLPLGIWVAYIYIVFFSDGILPGANALKLEQRTWEEVRDLSLNFFFVAPLLKLNFSPNVHPLLEGVFNALLAWAAMFAGFLSDDRTGAGSGMKMMNERSGSSSGAIGGGRNALSGGSSSGYYERLIQNQEQVLPDGTVVVPAVSTTKRNLLSLLPMVIGMQFLTSAFLLPYLVTRTSEREAPSNAIVRPLYKEELDPATRLIGESRILGIAMGSVGIISVYWGAAGRVDKFGPPIWESMDRMMSFMKLLSIDRVGTSFIVDLAIFAMFQGWLIDDDWKRRGKSMEEETFLRQTAKFVPFWGLAFYLIFRPAYPSLDQMNRTGGAGYIRDKRFDNIKNNSGRRRNDNEMMRGGGGQRFDNNSF